MLAVVFLLSGSRSTAKKPSSPAVDIHKVKKVEWIDPWGRMPIRYAEFKQGRPLAQPLRIQSLKETEKVKPAYKRIVSALVLVIAKREPFAQIQSSLVQ